MALSSLWSVVSWFCQGVSTFWRLPTISATVWLTLNPAPLVGDPKLRPTVPISSSPSSQLPSEAARAPRSAETDWKRLMSDAAQGVRLDALRSLSAFPHDGLLQQLQHFL